MRQELEKPREHRINVSWNTRSRRNLNNTELKEPEEHGELEVGGIT